MSSNYSAWAPRLFEIIFYLIYRLARAVVQLESDIYMLIRYFLYPPSPTNCCEILYIVARKRFHVGDVAREADFLAFHERMSTADELRDKQWMLYTINERYAYFVKLPQSSIEYNVTSAPFLSIAQFTNADALARISHHAFVRESYKMRHFTGQVVMLWTMPRCGSTLVSKMLQTADQTNRCLLVFSEPDAFSMLAMLVGQYAISISRTRKLLIAILRYTCKDQLLQQTIILKMRSNCTKLIPHVHAVAPHVSHAYTARKNLEDTVISQVDVARRSENIFATVLNLRLIHPCVCDWITTWGCLEWRLMREINPKSVLEVALAVVCQSFIDYVQYEQYFASPPIFYEDLMNDTKGTLKHLLNVCGISDVTLPNGVDSKRLDRPSTVSKDSFDLGRVELKSDDREIVREIAVLLAYPLIE